MKVAVGISGGVDSAVAALLLREQGHEVLGVTMTLGRADEAQSLSEARAAAERLGIELHIFDFASEWRKFVTDYIAKTYLAGETPNPCVRCNETVKFGRLPQRCFEELGCECFATGHYARVEVESEGGGRGGGGSVRLLRAKDKTKDQSYFLYRVKPEILSRTLFPLGELTKSEVRDLARKFSLTVADKGDSQDFCGGDVRGIIAAEAREGNIVTPDGKVLGRHQGYWNYTVGMRKGLGIGGGIPLYVVRLDAAKNEVVVAPKEKAATFELKLRDTVGLVDQSLSVKVRSAGEPKLLSEGIFGVAPGQSAVFYRGDEIVGGGIIC